MKTQAKRITSLIAFALATAGGNALAAGTVTGVTVSKNSITLGQSLDASVAGTVKLDAFKKGCAIRMSMKYADNTTEVTNPHFLADSFPQTGFYLKPAKAGKVTVIADGGTGSTLQWPACAGKAEVVINVAEPIRANIPGTTPMIKPPAGTAPGTVIVQQGPLTMAPLPTLTSIKQVPYTDQGTETWIEVHGTGNCTYTITGAGLPASTFSSSAATPFPMKVKIPNAPLGSHLWTAKGTGNCTGQATTTFKVEG